MKIHMLILFVVSGLLLIGVAIPLILEKIAPNPLYGFRVRATLDNPDVWYPANKYSGWTLLVAGVLTIVAAVVLYFIPGLGDTEYTTALTVIMLAALFGSAIASFWYLRTIVNR